MATNFRISARRHSKDLHVKLKGDFDGISAHELLAALKKYSLRSSKVFIHTGSLRDINPFGVRVFQGNLNVLTGHSLKLIFTGENASRLTPELPLAFDLTISTVPQ
jgi:anti-anti-sigma regulatory factor